MASPFPTVSPNDSWGQKLIDAIESRDVDVADEARAHADAILGAPTLVLGPQDPIPAGTPAGTVIYRTT